MSRVPDWPIRPPTVAPGAPQPGFGDFSVSRPCGPPPRPTQDRPPNRLGLSPSPVPRPDRGPFALREASASRPFVSPALAPAGATDVRAARGTTGRAREAQNEPRQSAVLATLGPDPPRASRHPAAHAPPRSERQGWGPSPAPRPPHPNPPAPQRARVGARDRSLRAPTLGDNRRGGPAITHARTGPVHRRWRERH